VIGVGSALSNLNQIAQAGGTNSAFIVDTNGNVGQQFIEALNAIRGAALACEYLIPSRRVGSSIRPRSTCSTRRAGEQR